MNFKVLLMKRSLSTVLNDEAYPLLLDREFLRQCCSPLTLFFKKNF